MIDLSERGYKTFDEYWSGTRTYVTDTYVNGLDVSMKAIVQSLKEYYMEHYLYVTSVTKFDKRFYNDIELFKNQYRDHLKKLDDAIDSNLKRTLTMKKTGTIGDSGSSTSSGSSDGSTTEFGNGLNTTALANDSTALGKEVDTGRSSSQSSNTNTTTFNTETSFDTDDKMKQFDIALRYVRNYDKSLWISAMNFFSHIFMRYYG